MALSGWLSIIVNTFKMCQKEKCYHLNSAIFDCFLAAIKLVWKWSLYTLRKINMVHVLCEEYVKKIDSDQTQLTIIKSPKCFGYRQWFVIDEQFGVRVE